MVAFRTLDALEVALDAGVVAFRKGPLEEGRVEEVREGDWVQC